MRKHLLNPSWGQTWKSEQKMFQNTIFLCFHIVLSSSQIYHIYILFFYLIEMVVNISDSFINVYLCSLKSSLGVKIKISAVYKLFVSKKLKYRFKNNTKIPYFTFWHFSKNDIVIPIDCVDVLLNTISFEQNEEK